VGEEEEVHRQVSGSMEAQVALLVNPHVLHMGPDQGAWQLVHVQESLSNVPKTQSSPVKGQTSHSLPDHWPAQEQPQMASVVVINLPCLHAKLQVKSLLCVSMMGSPSSS
jgi:hypothetical protein